MIGGFIPTYVLGILGMKFEGALTVITFGSFGCGCVGSLGGE